MSHQPDPYRTLGIPPSADAAQIQRAYRCLARRYHPDTHPSREDADRMATINAAYAVLGDPEARAAYNHGRRRETAPLPGDASPRPAGTPGAARWARTAAVALGLGIAAALGAALVCVWAGARTDTRLWQALRWLAMDTPVGRRAWAAVLAGGAAIAVAMRRLGRWTG
jgi:curved DNA-binding protein CbpA